MKEGTVLMKRAVQYLAEYNAALDLNQQASIPELQAVSCTPPTARTFNINVDGAVFPKQGAVGLGVLARDGYRSPRIYFGGRLIHYLSGSIWSLCTSVISVLCNTGLTVL